ncbi:MAG: dTMP kinase [Pseudomonadota bacterium]
MTNDPTDQLDMSVKQALERLSGLLDRSTGSLAVLPDTSHTDTGLFVSLEGGEGTGKSTQSTRLASYFSDLGHDVDLTREPGGSVGADILREVLLRGHALTHGTLAEASILSAARADHMQRRILPALAAGKTVICDRFSDSTRIYQGFVGGLSNQTIDAMEHAVTAGRMPDLTIVFDLSPDVALRRRESRRSSKADGDDRFETESGEFHQKVAEGFRWLAREWPNRCVLIDAEGSEDEVGERVEKAVHYRLGERVQARSAETEAAE